MSRAITAAFMHLRRVVEFGRLPKATRRGTKALRVLLFIYGDFRLNIHRVSPGASFLIGAATKRTNAADTRAGRARPARVFRRYSITRDTLRVGLVELRTLEQ
jgi:hypothetical protein